MGEGAGEAGADAAGNAGEMGGLPRRRFGIGLAADEGPHHKSDGEHADQQAEVVRLHAVDELHAEPRAEGDAGQKVF